VSAIPFSAALFKELPHSIEEVKTNLVLTNRLPRALIFIQKLKNHKAKTRAIIPRLPKK
jgi:hypothetical protein